MKCLPFGFFKLKLRLQGRRKPFVADFCARLWPFRANLFPFCAQNGCRVWALAAGRTGEPLQFCARFLFSYLCFQLLYVLAVNVAAELSTPCAKERVE